MKLTKTNDELLTLRRVIESDPNNRNSIIGSIFKYNLATRKKLDKIDRLITQNLADSRKAAGDPVSCDGYSGRQSNRR